MLVVIFVLAILYVFLNGLHDAPSILAQIHAARSLTPRQAILITGTLEFAGAVLFSRMVLKTMSFSRGNLNLAELGFAHEAQSFVLGALFVALVFNAATWYLGFPSSSTQALFGAMAGVALALGLGGRQIAFEMLRLMLILISSAFAGAMLGFLLTKGLLSLDFPYSWGVLWAARINRLFSAILPVLHGANDMPKSLGLFLVALTAEPSSWFAAFSMEAYLVLFAAMISLGVFCGENRILKTLGARLFRVRPVQALGANLVGVSTLAGCTAMGFPVSSTQVLIGALLGAGAAQNIKSVRWIAVGGILLSWGVTLPLCFALGYLMASFF